MPKIKKNAFVIKLSTGIFLSANTPREGVIIKCSLNNQYQWTNILMCIEWIKATWSHKYKKNRIYIYDGIAKGHSWSIIKPYLEILHEAVI